MAFAMVGYAVSQMGLGDMALALRLTRLAEKIVARTGASEYSATVLSYGTALVEAWSIPLPQAINKLKPVFLTAMESGHVEFALSSTWMETHLVRF